MEKIQDTLVRDIDEMKLIIQTKKEGTFEFLL